MDSTTAWMFVTRWGNSLLLLPAASCICVSLWASGDRRVAWHWAFCFGGAVFLVLASKVAFLGFGIGSRDLDFTGISGHSTLAASVLPMLGWWLTREQTPTLQRWSIAAGSMAAVGIGISRVLLSAHSASEVVVGLMLGSLVAWGVIPHGRVWKDGGSFRWAVLGVLLLAGALSRVGESGEAHGMVLRIALLLSGRTEPFTRDML